MPGPESIHGPCLFSGVFLCVTIPDCLTGCGTAAVELIAQKKFDEMVSFQPTELKSVPRGQSIASLRLVDPEGELVRMAEGMGTSFSR
ncbi:MAG TPA: hypothetical protein VEM40_08145 [Nitrospirota bacterium]|nr:hypothetical protein [Nitrospirota bacterium]